MARINPLAWNKPSKNELVVSTEESSSFLNAFTKALSSALDESSERRIRASRPRKNKTWKYQRAKSERIKLNKCVSKSVLKSSAKSDSDSSLDNWIDHQMDVSRKVFSHCTDSDEVTKSYTNFSDWRTCLNMGESDSVTESAHHARVPRRKRKFKRMAIDSPAKNAFLPIRSDIFCQKNKRNRNPKLQKSLKAHVKCSNVSKLPCPQISSKVKSVCPNLSREGSAYGKRKRAEKKFECTYLKPRLYSAARTLWTPSDFAVVDSSKNCLVARHSSSESECELSTNDESREADDEQSDFFCETGASKGVFKLEDECDDDDEDEEDDDEEESEDSYDETEKLCRLLELRFDYTPAFRTMYQRNRKRMYETMKKKIDENGGNVEANQRRLLKAYQSFSFLSEDDLLAEMMFKNNFPPKKM